MENQAITESESVLFSPLGHSDPTRGNYDGAFLHILRHYRPQTAYLYFTAEIGGYDQKDDRYSIMAHKLLPSCEIQKLYHPEITNPDDYSLFYQPFLEILQKMHTEYPNARILVNVSSGTPAMKSTLRLICELSNLPLLAVQVEGPRKGGNISKPVGENYDIEQEWAELMDNDPDMEPENRCKTVKNGGETQLFACLRAKSLVNEYDYHAALLLLSGFKDAADERTLQLIRAADLRLSLKVDEAQQHADQAGYSLLPIRSKGACELFEYILYLQVKLERKEILEFSRAVSPIFTELFRNYLLNVFRIDIRQCCDWREDKGYFQLRCEKLRSAGYLKIYDAFYKIGHFEECPLSFQSILPLLEHCCMKENRVDDWEKIQKLRDFEENVRNPCVHQLKGMTEQDLKKNFGFEAKDIISLLQQFYAQTFKSFSSHMDWDSYLKMNKAIVKRLGV